MTTIYSPLTSAAQSYTRYFSDAERVVALNDTYVDFVKSITAEDIKGVLFEDHLCCVTASDEMVGSYECIAERDTHGLAGHQGLIRITASTNGKIESTQFVTTLDALVDFNLATISQTHVEKTTSEDNVSTRTVSLNRTMDGYEASREVIENNKKTFERFYYTEKCLDGFLSEGANLLLQRLMVKRGLKSYFESVGLDSECHPCMISYIYLNDRTLPIGKQEVRVNGIERTVHSTVGLPLSWQTYFMADGHLILRLQVGSPIVIKIQEVPERFVQDQFLEQPEIPRPEFNWRDDMELYSRFLSQKDAIKADYLLYLRNHPVVKEMLSDFLQALLMRKPDNTIEFAVEFFKSFSSYGLPTKLHLSTHN
ncbi:Cilioproteinsis-associated TTC17-interacting protein [Clonorchis sinensis]|uniref:Ciliogenesis-associated TTC17-interacting protein n=1 Tax=Clonorchis sinensis TaxID=79923 RepID=A0A8T1MAW9_CLOSI|nr:Cilioproteinsis-associated TTC17-interacting protein [Clonorchis sinensis]